MIHPELRCPEHGYRYVTVNDTDSAELYKFKCPLRGCFFGVERDDITREGTLDAKTD